GEPGEDAALVRDGFAHHHVKGGDAVRGHQQQTVPQVVDVPHLALAPGKAGEIGAQHRGAHLAAVRAALSLEVLAVIFITLGVILSLVCRRRARSSAALAPVTGPTWT